jgi:folate-binding protein YgfZ
LDTEIHQNRRSVETLALTTMAPANIALLPDRGVVRVAGEDAERLLQGIITNDMGLLARQPAIHAALLTPQGKVLFDFFVVRAADGFLLEVAREKTTDLVKRLALYRLRAKVDIAEASEAWRVLALWGSSPRGLEEMAGAVSFPDPRLPDLGWRTLAAIASAAVSPNAAPEAYHAHRIALGVPEGGKDYAFGEAFPHEADLDLLDGVSFDKGCFIGQEVVSRMQHRGQPRKRVVPIEGDAPLASGAEVTAGAATIGTVGSVAGRQALAMVRLDRWAEAQAKGEPVRAGSVAITLRQPPWAKADFLSAKASAEAS